jgi:twitching motility two-component system response regulator PilH
MKKILIVEDDESMAFLEKKLLTAHGYEVVSASNAKDGLEAAAKERPDLILMDVRLPSKKRGIGTARILRNQEETRGIPIVFVTGYSQGQETKEVQNITNSSYIIKPFENDDLLKVIASYIG